MINTHGGALPRAIQVGAQVRTAMISTEENLSSNRPSFKLFVNSLLDNGLSKEALLERDLLLTKAGCLGLRRLACTFTCKHGEHI